MLEKIYGLLEKTNNIPRSTYVWNAMASMMLAMQSPIILMVMTRTNGVRDAGIYSIAIAIANLMMYVGQYGLRRFQASDINEQFTFNEYHGMRIITCAMLVIAGLGYCIYGSIFRGYSTEKFIVIFLVCLLKLAQAYSDVYHGNMQQKGRLDVGAKAPAIRYFVEIIVFCGMLIGTKNLVGSAVITVACSFVVMLLTSINAGRHFCETLRPEFNKAAIRGLAIEGFPLFVSMFLNTYVGNAPKYAIDAYLTDNIQAIFNYIFMPAFVVQIVAQFIFTPVITVYARLWLAHSEVKFKTLMKKMRKMYLAILGLTVLGLVVAATIGIPVLSIVFGVDLSAYKKELCIIMLGGGMLAYATYFSTVIAIIRVQKSLMVCYGVVSIASLLSARFFVSNYGITGASWFYAILMTILAIALFIAMQMRLNKEKQGFRG